MPSKKRTDGRNYAITWADCTPWIEQLYISHRCVVHCTVELEAMDAGVSPAIRVTGKRNTAGHTYEVLFEEWRVFDPKSTGEVERDVLHILSTSLLRLDNAKDAAAEADLPF